jgi:RES domain-containing protein
MIVTRIGPDTAFYRALPPRWAHLPESGAGAAIGGGRFNRIGLEARYLALTPHCALEEYRATAALIPPATLVCYTVTAEDVVDFTGGYSADQWSPIWAEAYCNWRQLAFYDKVEPPSWKIGNLVSNAGYAGILYRSAVDVTGTCLVLYPRNSAKFTAPVHDPDQLLPRNAESWRLPP